MNLSRFVGLAALTALPVIQAQTMRVIRFSEGKPFVMGKVTSRRIVHPDIGAKRTTLNYSVHGPMAPSSHSTFTITPTIRFSFSRARWI